MKKILILLMFAVSVIANADPDYGILIFNHQIAAGMSYGNVVAAWGSPTSVDRSFTNGYITEYWFMRNNWMVVFQNGKVVSFSQFGSPR